MWTDESRTTEAARFHYPRQQVEPFLCIADFFRPWRGPDGEPGEVDYAAFHIVTMGSAVSEQTARLFAANEYQQYLLLHGLGVEMAEALAEYWHKRHPRGVGLRRRGRPDASAGCSASSTAAAATRGATRPAPTSRTTPRSPGCSAPTASASR